jgi:hypothetical protein
MEREGKIVEREADLGCGPLYTGGADDDAAVWSQAPFFLAGHTAVYSAPSRSVYLFGGYDGTYVLHSLPPLPSLPLIL